MRFYVTEGPGRNRRVTVSWDQCLPVPARRRGSVTDRGSWRRQERLCRAHAFSLGRCRRGSRPAGLRAARPCRSVAKLRGDPGEVRAAIGSDSAMSNLGRGGRVGAHRRRRHPGQHLGRGRSRGDAADHGMRTLQSGQAMQRPGLRRVASEDGAGLRHRSRHLANESMLLRRAVGMRPVEQIVPVTFDQKINLPS